LPAFGVITIRIDPSIHIGPITVAWHGLTIAIGIVLGALLAGRWLRERGLASDPMYVIGVLVALGGVVGGRVFYLLERGGPVVGSNGFTFDGGVILAGGLIAVYVWRKRLSPGYLDVIAAAFPLGVAVGRIGDTINGEHYGPRSHFFLAVRNANPHALTPNPAFAYHNGGLYESLLALLIFAIVWPLRDRLRRPLDMTWLVLALFNAGRFAEFFLRYDSPKLALGLNNAQWTSLVLLIVVAIGWPVTRRLQARAGSTNGRIGSSRTTRSTAERR
jgi:phosphatidylglycerol---prolipoprotein diacylglyceryl transferase